MDLWNWNARPQKIAAVGDGGTLDEPPHLPDDIIFLILTRLPAKDALRCRSVSKLWNALVSSPRFTRHHHSLASRRNLTTFLAAFPVDLRRSFSLVWITVDREAMRIRVDRDAYDRNAIREFACVPDIIGDACSGVFCVRYRQNPALWNPATRELKVVEFEFPSGAVRLDLNRARYVGFGSVKDEIGNVVDFKILFMLKMDEEKGQTGQFLIYSLRKNSLSLVGSPNFPLQSVSQNGSVYLNEVLYWLAKGGEGAKAAYILTFNLVSETFGQIEVPCADGIKIHDRNNNFLSVQDDKYLSFGMVYQEAEFLDLWVIREVNGQRFWVWGKRVGPLMKTGLMLRYSDCIGGVITQTDLDGRFWYQVEGNGSKHETGLYGLTNWFGYSESLVSLKNIANRTNDDSKNKK